MRQPPVAIEAKMRTAVVLWILMALFFFRVLGQILVEFGQVTFLPPSEEWFSGLLPYPQLLTSQILILLLMLKIGLDFTRRSGWSYRPRVHLASGLLVFGGVYLTVMILRYIIRMSLYPHERWTGGSIPIFFHWVLALYVLLLGLHHRRVRIHKHLANPLTGWKWIMAGLVRFAGGLLIFVGVATWTISLLLPSLLARQLGIRPAEYAVRIEPSVGFITSDDVSLVANIYRPRRAGKKSPTILVRIPYSKTLTNRIFASVTGQMWAERGYTVVIQGTRGRYESGGRYDPFHHERQDGIETLNWIAAQPWYDGHVGMWGCSYFGYTQWVLADLQHPGLKALLVGESSTDFYGMFHPGGAFSLKSALYWAVMSHGGRDVIPNEEALSRGFTSLSLLEADDRAVKDIDFFNDWVLHTERDDYWSQVDGDRRAAESKAPVLLLAGWYDPFLPTQLQDFIRIRREGESGVSVQSRLIIGPWSHAQTVTFPDGTVPRNFRLESLASSVAWFDQHLRGVQAKPEAPVRIYVMGRHEWRDEQKWPLERTEYTPFYLHSEGKANGSSRGGTLTRTPPQAEEASDQYAYDPRKPVPTRGGAMIGYDTSAGGFNAGIEQQNDIEAREDILIYTTEPLAEDLEVTGPIELVLFVSTTAPNTDFTGKLVDVWPDGSAFNVSEGILRRQYRSQLNTGTEITIALWPTSTVFLKGHQIRLEVSSSNYPRFDRNPNTGESMMTATESVLAHQTVHHGVLSPSRLILPLIPAMRVDSK
jgi:putative CocE/NonD family hydrolase